MSSYTILRNLLTHPTDWALASLTKDELWDLHKRADVLANIYAVAFEERPEE